MERFGPIQEQEIERQEIWKRNYYFKDWQQLHDVKDFRDVSLSLGPKYSQALKETEKRITKDGANSSNSKPAVPTPLQDTCRLDFALPTELQENLKSTYDDIMKPILDDALKLEDYYSPRQCAFCNKDGYDLLVCSKCKVTFYCSSKCQKDNDRNHARECQKIFDSRMKEIQKNVQTAILSESKTKLAAAKTNGQRTKKNNNNNGRKR